MSYYIYLISCRGDRYYAGICLDLSKRYQQHCTGRGAKFTRAFAPQRLAAAWRTSGDRSQAQQIEAQLKHLSHQQKHQLAQAPEQFIQYLPASLAPQPFSLDVVNLVDFNAG